MLTTVALWPLSRPVSVMYPSCQFLRATGSVTPRASRAALMASDIAAGPFGKVPRPAKLTSPIGIFADDEAGAAPLELLPRRAEACERPGILRPERPLRAPSDDMPPIDPPVPAPIGMPPPPMPPMPAPPYPAPALRIIADSIWPRCWDRVSRALARSSWLSRWLTRTCLPAGVSVLGAIALTPLRGSL